MPKQTLILAAALALGTSWASAQAVWRCGSAYSDRPCAGGAAVATSDPRSPAEAAAATRAAGVDAKLAAQLERERLARERNAPKAVIIGPQAPAPAPASAPARPVKVDGTKPKAGKLEQFTAVAPGTKGKKK